MNNLIQNYAKVLYLLQEICGDIYSKKQYRVPKLSALELSALNFTAEFMSIDTELHLFRMLKDTELETKIERTVFNKRIRNLFGYFTKIQQRISSKFSHLSNTFIVDSTMLEVCKLVRAGRSNICATDEIHPNFGYKLHCVCDDNSIIHSFDLTPASVHDINYLKDVKYNFANCEIIGDKGYISADYQVDLFNYNQIK
jgi:hypothetical protein